MVNSWNSAATHFLFSALGPLSDTHTDRLGTELLDRNHSIYTQNMRPIDVDVKEIHIDTFLCPSIYKQKLCDLSNNNVALGPTRVIDENPPYASFEYTVDLENEISRHSHIRLHRPEGNSHSAKRCPVSLIYLSQSQISYFFPL